jgi:hypothetical protein
MIQIEDWIVITGILIIFVLSAVYLVYVIIKTKLMPKVLEFQKEIKPNEAITISAIEGSGIIKKIEMKTIKNDKSLITITVDQTSFITFDLSKKTSSPRGNLDLLEESVSFEINLNKYFKRNVTIFFYNNSDKLSQSNGKIYYEIKKPLKITLRTLLSELFH